MAKKFLQLQCRDGTQLAADWYRPDGEARAAVVVAGALGVPRGFYAPLAEWLASRGVAVLTFDYRGTGDSSAGSLQGKNILLQHWGEQDIDAAIQTLAEKVTAPVFLLGHSCGGQLIGLAEASAKLAGALLVAATAPRWTRYPMPSRLGMLAVWHLMIPVVAAGRDVFPARKLGFSTIDVPAGVMRQWAQWARSRGYLFSAEHGLDTRRYSQLDIPMLSLAFDDDSYASQQAVDALLKHYPAASMDSRCINVRELGIGSLGHFGFFRDKCRDSLWADALDWIVGGA